MDTVEKIKALAGRIEKQKESVLTEEACKTAFVMPFLSALGYDVFDPGVVVPEFTADVGTKKGEKVGYAIKIGGSISILIECKGCGANLAGAHMSQLYRYFSVTESRFAILTNGIDYWFYTDLDAPNKMDQRPFFQFNVLDHRASDLTELQKFAFSSFDVDVILSTASNLKYSSAIKMELMKEFDAPSEEIIRMLVGRVFDGRYTQKVRDDFAPLVASAFNDAIRDLVSQRLTSALEATGAAPTSRTISTPTSSPAVAPTEVDPEIVTTEEELEGFHIIKAVVRSVIKADRVVMRDAKSYCAILVDDNNRRPLARLHFNSKSVRYITIFGPDKSEDKIRKGLSRSFRCPPSLVG
ncbi:type I restriction enzyme HsdR N-terminal domain-containing protein [Indioceanicola profundi]|uniref:type I restriction enzyme HsdR N-terminal domain-containing protein n=1 Tax=Indioceanicola profundi TaxID=2220096 RepID=UPI0013C41F25|nr:type I restriction enzyme HsdR N-terminal domain-containing protein [Indioceanicola profundi]